MIREGIYMKIVSSKIYCLLLISLLFLLMPTVIPAQSEQNSPGPPPVAPPLVREGAFAIRLGEAFALETNNNEVEAENRLSEIGIIPKNGWMADYPVTPDIVGELYEAIGLAADANKLSISREEALKRFNNAVAGVNLSVAPSFIEKQIEAAPPGLDNFPNAAIVNNYYTSEGPPVFTYYTPPPAYNYLYDWVAYPFWWTNVWFPGYFILRDFHRTVYINRSPAFVSNHFRDHGSNRYYRVDPGARFRGRALAGGNMSHTGVSPGVSGGGISHTAPHAPSFSGGRTVNPPLSGGGTMAGPRNHPVAPTASYQRGHLMTAPPSPGVRTFTSTSYGSGAISSSHQGRGSFGGQSFGSGSARAPSHGGGMTGRASFGGGSSSGRGHRR
jgi:hypothetical protein